MFAGAADYLPDHSCVYDRDRNENFRRAWLIVSHNFSARRVLTVVETKKQSIGKLSEPWNRRVRCYRREISVVKSPDYAIIESGRRRIAKPVMCTRRHLSDLMDLSTGL
jgi:hypothetical protein